MKLHSKILLGLIIGLIAGIAVNQFTAASDSLNTALEVFITNLTDPIGQIFLRLLFMIVVPLVLASLSLGVVNLGNRHQLGRIGLKAILFFLLLTVSAVIIGLLLVQVFQPGKHFDPDMQAVLIMKYGDNTSQLISKSREISISLMMFIDMLLPKNMIRAVVDMQMLPVIVLSFLFGVMMHYFQPPVMESCKRGLTALYEFSIRIVDLAMRFAPFAVPCLVFGIAARFGLGVLKPLGIYVVLVFAGYVIHLFLVYSVILRTFGRMNPVLFYKTVKSVMITAFSTSSSNATLPTTIKTTQEELKISFNIAGFVLPLGATVNMNGTALYEGLTVLFIGQIFGIDLSLSQQLLVVVMTVLTAIGTAGIPGGSLPMIILVMQTVGIPAEGIGIILGVDRILDMGRTVVNVTGDMVTTVCVAQTENNKT